MISIEIHGREKIDISKFITEFSFNKSIDFTDNKSVLQIQIFKKYAEQIFKYRDKFSRNGKQIIIKYNEQMIYWGVIENISFTSSFTEQGIELYSISLFCDSIMIRALNSEIIHSNNADFYGVVSSETLANYGAYLRQENDFAKILAYTLDQFSFLLIPPSLLETRTRLADIINICDGMTGYHLPILEQYADERSTVKSLLKQGLVSPNEKILTLQKFMTIFQQTPDLVEFFFVLIPYSDEYKIDQKKKVVYKKIGCIPTLILRYKPLPPKFAINQKILGSSVPTYTEDTTDRSKISYLEIPQSMVLSISGDSDRDMINAVSVYNGVSDQNSSVAFTLAESLNHLIINREDAEFFGISHKIINNFYVQDPSPLKSASLTELGWCLHGDSAYYSEGIIKLSLSFINALTIGVWCRIGDFTAYIKGLEYRISMSDKGMMEGFINVSYVRGSNGRLPTFAPQQIKNDYPQNNSHVPVNPIPQSQVSKRG
jgi:hypothetical protein